MLENFKDLKEQGKKIPAEFYNELLHYSVILINHLHLEIKDEYLELLDDFREKRIENFNFCKKLMKRQDSIEEVSEILQSHRILLSPSKNSSDFGCLMLELYDTCQAYSEAYIGEVQLRDSVERIYLEMKKYSSKIIE